MIKETIYWFLCLACFFLLHACKKENERTCFKNAGTYAKWEKNIPPFDVLTINGDFDLMLIQDTINKIIVEGGKNLIPFLTYKYNENQLTLFNKNRCNFLRNYKHRIWVTLHFTSFKKLLFKDAGTIQNKDTLNFNILELLNDNSSGSVNLTLKAKEIYTKIIIGTADIKLNGTVEYSYAYNGSFGLIDLSNLYTSDALCYNNGTGAIKIYSNYLLKIQLDGTGNVYVYGNPANLQIYNTGKGKVLLK